MTPEEYKRKLNSIPSICEMLKDNTPQEYIEALQQKWILELERQNDNEC